jgi:hypothetical protein
MRDFTFESAKVKTPPTRSFPDTESVVSNDAKVVPVPLNDFALVMCLSNCPQKKIVQSGAVLHQYLMIVLKGTTYRDSIHYCMSLTPRNVHRRKS